MTEYQYMMLLGNMYIAANFIITRQAKGALFCSALWVVTAIVIKLFM